MDAKWNAMTPRDKATGRKRKTYDRPEMVVYGDIRAITQSVDMAGSRDMIGGGSNKT